MSEAMEARGGSFAVELQTGRTDPSRACARSAGHPLRDGGHQRL